MLTQAPSGGGITAEEPAICSLRKRSAKDAGTSGGVLWKTAWATGVRPLVCAQVGREICAAARRMLLAPMRAESRRQSLAQVLRLPPAGPKAKGQKAEANQRDSAWFGN